MFQGISTGRPVRRTRETLRAPARRSLSTLTLTTLSFTTLALTTLAITPLGGWPAVLAQNAPASTDSLRPRPLQGRSLLGERLLAQADTGGVIPRADSIAARNPRDVDSLIAAGGLYASIWRYQGAIDLYTRAMRHAPRDARPYRYRGHRHISLRRFPEAVRDLERGRGLDSASYDIAYHLGLAYYLMGNYDKAATEYARCMAYASHAGDVASDTAGRKGVKSCTTVAHNDDDLVGMAEWRYRSLIRAGRASEAERLLAGISDSLAVRESGAYYQALLVSKGRREGAAVLDSLGENELQRATVAYGLGVRQLVAGDTTRARAMFEEIARIPYWPAFGVIGSETEVHRFRRRR